MGRAYRCRPKGRKLCQRHHEHRGRPRGSRVAGCVRRDLRPYGQRQVAVPSVDRSARRRHRAFPSPCVRTAWSSRRARRPRLRERSGRLLHSLLTRKVDLLLNAIVSRLISDGSGVGGVTMVNGAGPKEILAGRGVVLATGGFSHRPEMRAKDLPNSAGAFSAACRRNTGDGIELASLVGGRGWNGNTDNAFWTPVSHFVRRDGSEGIFPHTMTDRAKPGVIAVKSTRLAVLLFPATRSGGRRSKRITQARLFQLI
jgi:FAD binding domain